MSVKLVASNDTIIAHARKGMSEIEKKMPSPTAIIIVALAEDGTYSLKSYSDTKKIKDFDMYSRAGAILDRQKDGFLA